MSTEHLPADYPRARHGWTNHVLTGFEQIGQSPMVQSWLAGLSDAMIYVAGAMLAFVVAIDGFVLFRTM